MNKFKRGKQSQIINIVQKRKKKRKQIKLMEKKTEEKKSGS